MNLVLFIVRRRYVSHRDEQVSPSQVWSKSRLVCWDRAKAA